ncbi:nuclear transport factor 2 family protein [Lewinella sp. JB7]|uniref:nuclear transport factor 2 family protein n=1 Tax=Lewinella sp. JB7 TaxID=2962887 RepID=UPI0020C96757|nr:nuclear transport factor 2 family protein [Lewinella sp. JB7]MCP9234681.1 nuclear transport factor 2 family protein [Lewinella sp. JB7]
MPFRLLFLLLITALSPFLSAQDTPRATLLQLFDGMRAGDSTGMAILFYPGASLQSVSVDGAGNTVVTPGSIDQWLAGLHRAEAGVLDEQLHYTEIRTDGRLATAWTPYTFVLNGEIHHCGTNAFQLVQSAERWRIVNIMDTRDTSGCTLPSTTPVAQQLEDLATGWHAAAGRADADTFFDALTPDAVYIGTDPGEHWTRDEFYAFAKPYFEAGKAWDFTATERHVFHDPDSNVAYWDELLDTWMGPCRGTAVVKRDERGAWKIAHYTLSMTVPNERVEAVIKAINE